MKIYPQLLMQIIVLFITALVLDHGVIMKCCVISMIIYWCIFLFLATRVKSWTGTYLYFFRYGFFPIFLLVLTINHFIIN